MKRSSFLASACLVAGGLLLGTTQAFAVTDEAFLNVYQVMQRAQAGDKSEIAPAVEGFATLLKAEPANPILLVNLGAATAMQSRTTMLPWKKIGHAEDGMALQDKALALLTPEHDALLQNGNPIALSVRFVAANTWLAVPGFFNRGDRGEKLLNEVLGSPLFASTTLQFKGAAWLRAGRLAQKQQRNEDAVRYFKLVLDANAPQAATAKELLQAAAQLPSN